MIDKKIETFLEKTDLNYVFCLLAKLESQRLSQLPTYVRQRLEDKIAVISMDHVASNEVPDYFADIEEANLIAAQQGSPFADDDIQSVEETFDDSEDHIEELIHDNLERYADDEDDEEFAFANEAEEAEEEEEE